MRFIGRNNKLKSRNNFAEAKVSFKENIGILKDTLDVVWKLSPIALLPIGLLLWSYLQSFGWTTLFYDGAMSGLVFLVVAGVVLAFVVFLMFVIPSALVIATAHFYDLDRKIPIEVIRLHQLALAVWIVVISLIAAFGSQIPPWLALVLPWAIGSLYGARKIDKLQLPSANRYPKVARIVLVFTLSGLATLAMCVTSFALLITFNIGAQFGDVDGWKAVLILGACIFISMIGVIPGFMFLKMRTRHKGVFEPTKMALVGSIMVAYILITAMAMLPQTQLMFLRTAGVYGEVRTTFQILKTDLIPAFSYAGIEVTTESKMPIVAACVRYNFAGTRLLCRKPFDINQTSSDSVRDAKGKGLPNPREAGGWNCVPTLAGELRELRTTAKNSVPNSCSLLNGTSH